MTVWSANLQTDIPWLFSDFSLFSFVQKRPDQYAAELLTKIVKIPEYSLNFPDFQLSRQPEDKGIATWLKAVTKHIGVKIL